MSHESDLKAHEHAEATLAKAKEAAEPKKAAVPPDQARDALLKLLALRVATLVKAVHGPSHDDEQLAAAVDDLPETPEEKAAREASEKAEAAAEKEAAAAEKAEAAAEKAEAHHAARAGK
jgi:colicin import membrane protein